MTDPDLPDAGEPLDAPAPDADVQAPRRRSRWLRRTLITSAALLVVVVSTLIFLYFWASSAAVEEQMKKRVTAELEDATGGRVEIAGFHWDLLHLRVEARGITIHGTEPAGEAPYAHIERLRLQVAVLGLFTSGVSTRVVLREAEIQQPAVHLMVNADGTTNQPHPHHAPKPGKAAIETLFDWEIGQLAIEQGTLHIANQVVPLDLRAHDANLQLSWIPGITPQQVGSYRIGIGLSELSFAQEKFRPVTSRIDASVHLLRDSIQLDSLRLNALGQVLTLRGQLVSFRHPEWQAQSNGQIDLRILAPYTGFAYCRDGVVTLNATANGHGTEFLTAGDLASRAIHYQDTVVDAQTAAFSARFREIGRAHV